MSLKQELASDIDKERFDEIFEALFVRPKASMSPEFYESELDRAATQYPLLGKVMDATEAMVFDLRDQNYGEEAVNMFLRGRAIACLAIAAYVSVEIDDAPDV